ncbi:MAG: GNAT family N-acetyltransferase [Mycobacteriales bacterium]
MARRVAGITVDNVDDLPLPCRACVFWEHGPRADADPPAGTGTAQSGKEDWISAVLLDWGCCGSVVHVDGELAGFVLYAPAGYVPRSEAFGSSPVAPDAVLLMTARVAPDFAGEGIGRLLIQAAAKDLIRRGFRAVEAFGRVTSAVSAFDPTLPDTPCCVLPVEFLQSVGFKTVRPHGTAPRLRLELRSIATWRDEVESALERLLGTVDRGGTPRTI